MKTRWRFAQEAQNEASFSFINLPFRANENSLAFCAGSTKRGFVFIHKPSFQGK
jgi:hypothetical protein